MPQVTEQGLDRAQQLARLLLIHATEFDPEAAIEELDAFFEQHRGALVGAGVDYVFALARAAIADTPIEEITAHAAPLEEGALVHDAEAEASAIAAERLRVVEGRRELLVAVRALSGRVLQGALSAALMAALAAA